MSELDVFQMLKLLQMKEYVDTAAGTLLIWDYILNIRDEIQLIWRSRWSWIKLLYIITRYLSLSYVIADFIVDHFKTALSGPHCKIMFNVLGWCNILAISSAEVILFIRTSAIWGNTMRIKLFLFVLSIGATIPAFCLAGIFLATVEVGPSCAVLKAKSIVNVELLFMFLYDLLVLVLTAIKAVPYYRNHLRLRCRIGTDADHTIQHIVYRDGLIFYMYLMTLTIINAVYALKAMDNAPDGMVLQNLQLVLHSVISSNVVLNVRRTAPSDDMPSPATSLEPIQMHTIEFAPRRFKETDTGIWDI